MENDLIVVEQIPIITEKLHEVSKEIEGKVAYAKNLICTEENKQAIKQIRTNFKKDFEEYEIQRKKVKEKIMTPYLQFEDVYKECIADKFKVADKELKDKIDLIENEQKRKIEQEAREFLEKCKKEHNIDFINFEQLKIKIGLSDTITKLQKQILSVIDKVIDDLKLINIQENKEEILFEYKKSLNVSEAITMVVSRKKAIEAEKLKAEEPKKETNNIPEIKDDFEIASEEFSVIPEKHKIQLELTVDDSELNTIIKYLDMMKIQYERKDK